MSLDLLKALNGTNDRRFAKLIKRHKTRQIHKETSWHSTSAPSIA